MGVAMLVYTAVIILSFTLATIQMLKKQIAKVYLVLLECHLYLVVAECWWSALSVVGPILSALYLFQAWISGVPNHDWILLLVAKASYKIVSGMVTNSDLHDHVKENQSIL
jgi:hypothetical protein